MAFGIDKLKVLVSDLADTCNTVSSVIHGGSILSLFSLAMELKDLLAFDWVEVLNELKDLDASERQALEAQFSSQLKLVDPKVQLVVVGSVSALEQAIGIVAEGVKVYEDVSAFIAKVKQLFSL